MSCRFDPDPLADPLSSSGDEYRRAGKARAMNKRDKSEAALREILEAGRNPDAKRALDDISGLAELHAVDALAPFVEGFCGWLVDQSRRQGALDRLRDRYDGSNPTYVRLRRLLREVSGVTVPPERPNDGALNLDAVVRGIQVADIEAALDNWERGEVELDAGIAQPDGRPSLWQSKLRSRKPAVENDPTGHTRQVRYCIERGIIGVGWEVDLPPGSDLDDVLETIQSVYDDPAGVATVRRFARDAKAGEFVWSRDTDGQYILCKITGPWRYEVTPEARSVDIHQVRDVAWFPRSLDVDDVPEAVVKSFLGPSQSFRRIDPHGKYAEDPLEATRTIWEAGESELDTLVTIHERVGTGSSGGTNRSRRVDARRDATALLDTTDDDDQFVKEGAVRYGIHRFRERDHGIIAAKKQAVRDEYGRLACEVCRYDFEQRWPDLGSGFIECHHLLPLSEGERETRIGDLAIVCSNCHRMFHRVDPGTSVEQLQSRFAPT